MLGDDVRSRTAADCADVDRDAGPTAVERGKRQRLVRELEDRAAALLRLDAGVSGAALRPDDEIGDALARADDVTVGAGRLEHEADVDAFGGLADDRRRDGRADLLVGVGQTYVTLANGSEPIDCKAHAARCA